MSPRNPNPNKIKSQFVYVCRKHPVPERIKQVPIRADPVEVSIHGLAEQCPHAHHRLVERQDPVDNRRQSGIPELELGRKGQQVPGYPARPVRIYMKTTHPADELFGPAHVAPRHTLKHTRPAKTRRPEIGNPGISTDTRDQITTLPAHTVAHPSNPKKMWPYILPITVCAMINTSHIPTLGLSVTWTPQPPCDINYTQTGFINDLATFALVRTNTPFSRWMPPLWFYSTKQSGTLDQDACADWLPAFTVVALFLGLACFAVNKKAAFTLKMQVGTF